MKNTTICEVRRVDTPAKLRDIGVVQRAAYDSCLNMMVELRRSNGQGSVVRRGPCQNTIFIRDNSLYVEVRFPVKVHDDINVVESGEELASAG